MALPRRGNLPELLPMLPHLHKSWPAAGRMAVPVVGWPRSGGGEDAPSLWPFLAHLSGDKAVSTASGGAALLLPRAAASSSHHDSA